MTNSVSVIIPTYNRSFSLERAVVSVMKQTLPSDELIIVDDGSTDDTYRRMQELSKKYPGKIITFHQSNSGPAAARNLGIKNAKGSMIAFLDSDDHWKKTKLEKQFHVMQKNPECLISHTKEIWFRKGKHLNQKKIHIPRTGDIFDHCVILCGVGMSTVMARKQLFDLVGQFDEDFQCCEDYEFWLRVSAKYSFKLIDEALTIKEGGRADQLSVKHRVGMDKLRIHALLKLLQSFCLPESKRILAVNELKNKCRIYGQGCLKHNKKEEGDYYLQLLDQY